jgi:plastocyanin
MTDETEPTDAEAPQGEGTAVAVVEEPAPPAVWPPEPTPLAERRKERFWLPLLLPIGAIVVVAFVAINVSRVFLAASEHSTTPAVIIAAGITLAILVGATVISALPKIRTSSLVIGMCAVMVVVLLSGSLVLGASESHKAAGGGYVEPAGPAINTLEVDALPSLRFQSSAFTAPAGVNLVKYIDKGGTHTLVFENAFPGFHLAVPVGVNQLKADFVDGQKYTIYCTIPGHRAAGMEATVTVGPAPATPTPEPGTQTPTSTTASSTGTRTPSGTAGTDKASQTGNSLGN